LVRMCLKGSHARCRSQHGRVGEGGGGRSPCSATQDAAGHTMHSSSFLLGPGSCCSSSLSWPSCLACDLHCGWLKLVTTGCKTTTMMASSAFIIIISQVALQLFWRQASSLRLPLPLMPSSGHTGSGSMCLWLPPCRPSPPVMWAARLSDCTRTHNGWQQTRCTQASLRSRTHGYRLVLHKSSLSSSMQGCTSLGQHHPAVSTPVAAASNTHTRTWIAHTAAHAG
jgi:hypothetical protein